MIPYVYAGSWYVSDIVLSSFKSIISFELNNYIKKNQ